ncbi:hypothetical protein P7C70_g8171, partial [Phenoliferia sp. Uapishka_3]
MSQTSPSLFSLPPELLVEILSTLDPLSASRFFLTSRASSSFSTNFTLNKSLFLSLFDPPPTAEEATFDWAGELRKRVGAMGWIIDDGAIARLGENAEAFETTMETLVEIAETRTTAIIGGESKNQQFLEAHLGGLEQDEIGLEIGSTGIMDTLLGFDRHKLRTRKALKESQSNDSARLAQLKAHLHVLHTPSFYSRGFPAIRTLARECVYDQ